jgi:hypothetical protein
MPIDLRGFRIAHTSLAAAFKSEHGVTLDAVLAVVVALSYRVFRLWKLTAGRAIVRYWQRAYEGPYKRDEFFLEIMEFLPMALSGLGLNQNAISPDEFRHALKFWELDDDKRAGIDLVYSGPHYFFLPYRDDRIFIDYAWIERRLYDLFVGLPIEDGHFKGDALEIIVGRDRSVLPKSQCRLANGESRQIDCAYSIGSHLIIVECKAVARSVGYDRGNPNAIQFRTDKIVERGLSEADEKAHWLAQNPVGTNYNITGFADILPIAVSPFVEFIPSKGFRYWITEQIPRVLTPDELANLLSNQAAIDRSMNRVDIRRLG